MNENVATHTLRLSEPDGQYRADCSCGWVATSVSAELRAWNTDGHVANVRDYDVAGDPLAAAMLELSSQNIAASKLAS